MNLAEDYFSKTCFSEKKLSEILEEAKSDAKILYFDQVFRRHHTWNDPINFIDPIGLWGFGVTAGGSAEGGVGVVGAGGTGFVGGGVFGGGSEGINVGGFAGGGAFAGGPGYGSSEPQCQDNQTGALGAFAGAGAGVFFTNATRASQLAGYSNTYSFNLGVGPIKFSAQLGRSGNIWSTSFTFGPGIGISGSTYPTWTNSTK